MRTAVAGLRLLAALAVAAAVIATYLDSVSRGPVNPLNFFGFFTIQSNILTGVVLAALAVTGLRGRRASRRLQLARAAVTTYIAIVGIVYNTLLAGLPGGVELAWANTILHVVIPLYTVIDWVLVGDRDRIPMSRLGIVLVYPIVWLVVVLVRGATDGWVPYPFLNPGTGYPSVIVYCLVIAIAFAVVGALVLASSRLRVLRA